MTKHIRLIGPQFIRMDPISDKFIPKTQGQFKAFIENADSKRLLEVGFCLFDEFLIEYKYHGLFLFPKEWYNYIPAGFKVIDICMNPELFIPGESDDDVRFGCLPYGVIKEINP